MDEPLPQEVIDASLRLSGLSPKQVLRESIRQIKAMGANMTQEDWAVLKQISKTLKEMS